MFSLIPAALMPLVDGEETSEATYATLSSIATNLGSVATWFWGIFSDMIDVITTNDVILWPIVLALVCGAIMMAVRFVKKFGLRGRR